MAYHLVVYHCFSNSLGQVQGQPRVLWIQMVGRRACGGMAHGQRSFLAEQKLCTPGIGAWQTVLRANTEGPGALHPQWRGRAEAEGVGLLLPGEKGG